MSDETPKRRGSIKPAEFLRQLESDSAWVARRDARDAELQVRAAALAKAARPLVEDLWNAGVLVSSVWDLALVPHAGSSLPTRATMRQFAVALRERG